MTAQTPPPGYVTVPAEMTAEQAARTLAGSTIADRVRTTNPEMFAEWVERRRAAWRQWVAVMQETTPPDDQP